jgi:hypothetical protein
MPVLYKSSQNIRPDIRMPCSLRVGSGLSKVTCALSWTLCGIKVILVAACDFVRVASGVDCNGEHVVLI